MTGDHSHDASARLGRNGWLALACIAGVAAWGCSTTLTPPPKLEAQEVFRVGPPDVLTIHVLPDPPIERVVTVRPDGKISLDLVGDVQAGGRTVAEIAADLETRMKRFKRGATVSVAVQQTNSTEITVLGEVRSPQSFPLVKRTRVVEAIGLVGGVRPFAWDSRIRVVRTEGGETVTFKVDLPAIRSGDLATNIELTTGDIVYVPPTILARIGYTMQALLFPLQPIVGGSLGALIF